MSRPSSDLDTNTGAQFGLVPASLRGTYRPLTPIPVPSLPMAIEEFLLSLPLGTDLDAALVEQMVGRKLLEGEAQRNTLTKKLQEWSQVAVELHQLVEQQHRHLQQLTLQAVSQRIKNDEQQAEMRMHLLPAVAAKAAAMTAASILGSGGSTPAAGGGSTPQTATPRPMSSGHFTPAAPDTAQLRSLQAAVRQMASTGAKWPGMGSGGGSTGATMSGSLGTSGDGIMALTSAFAASPLMLQQEAAERDMQRDKIDGVVVVARHTMQDASPSSHLVSGQELLSLQQELTVSKTSLAEQTSTCVRYSEEIVRLRAALRDAEADIQRIAQKHAESTRTSGASGASTSSGMSSLMVPLQPSTPSYDHQLIHKAQQDLLSMRAEMESRQAEMDTRLGKLQSRQAEMQALQAGLDAHQAGLDTRQAALDARDVDLRKREEEVRRQRQEVQSHRDELRQQQDELGRQEAALVAGEAEVQELRAALVEVQEQLRVQEKQLPATESDLEGQDQELVALRGDIQALQEEVLVVRKKLARREEEVMGARVEVEGCRQELIVAQTECEGLRVKMAVVELSCESLRGQLAATDSAHDMLEGVCGELKSQLELSQGDSRRLGAELHQASSAQAHLEADLDQLRTELHAARAECLQLKEKHESLQHHAIEQSKALQNQHAVVVHELNEALEDSCHKLVVAQSEHKSDVMSMTSTIKEARELCGDMQEQILVLHAALHEQAALREQIVELQEELQVAKDRAQELEEELVQVRRASEEDAVTAKEHVQDVELALSVAQEQLCKSHEQIKHVYEELKMARARAEAAEASNEVLMHQAQAGRLGVEHALDEQREKHAIIMQQQEDAISSLQQALDEQKAAQEEQQQHAGNVSVKAASAQWDQGKLEPLATSEGANVNDAGAREVMDVVQLEAKLKEANEELEAAKDVVTTLQERWDTSKEELAQSKVQLERVQIERDSLRLQLDQGKHDLSHLYTQLATTQAALAEAHAEQLRLAEECGGLKRDCQAAEKQHLAVTESLAEAKVQVELHSQQEQEAIQAQHVAEQLHEACVSSVKSVKDHEMLKGEVERLRSGLRNKEEALEVIRKEVSAWQDQVHAAHRQYAGRMDEQLVTLEQALDTKQQEVEEARRTVDAGQAALVSMKIELNDRVAVAEAGREGAERRAEEVDSQLGVLRARMADLEQQLLGAESVTRYQSHRILELEGDVEELTSRLSQLTGLPVDTVTTTMGHPAVHARTGSHGQVRTSKAGGNREAMLEEEVARLNEVIQTLESALVLRQNRLQTAQASVDMVISQVEHMRHGPSSQAASVMSPSQRSPYRPSQFSSPLAMQLAAATATTITTSSSPAARHLASHLSAPPHSSALFSNNLPSTGHAQTMATTLSSHPSIASSGSAVPYSSHASTMGAPHPLDVAGWAQLAATTHVHTTQTLSSQPCSTACPEQTPTRSYTNGRSPPHPTPFGQPAPLPSQTPANLAQRKGMLSTCASHDMTAPVALTTTTHLPGTSALSLASAPTSATNQARAVSAPGVTSYGHHGVMTQLGLHHACSGSDRHVDADSGRDGEPQPCLLSSLSQPTGQHQYPMHHVGTALLGNQSKGYSHVAGVRQQAMGPPCPTPPINTTAQGAMAVNTAASLLASPLASVPPSQMASPLGYARPSRAEGGDTSAVDSGATTPTPSSLTSTPGRNTLSRRVHLALSQRERDLRRAASKMAGLQKQLDKLTQAAAGTLAAAPTHPVLTTPPPRRTNTSSLTHPSGEVATPLALDTSLGHGGEVTNKSGLPWKMSGTEAVAAASSPAAMPGSVSGAAAGRIKRGYATLMTSRTAATAGGVAVTGTLSPAPAAVPGGAKQGRASGVARAGAVKGVGVVVTGLGQLSQMGRAGGPNAFDRVPAWLRGGFDSDSTLESERTR